MLIDMGVGLCCCSLLPACTPWPIKRATLFLTITPSRISLWIFLHLLVCVCVCIWTKAFELACLLFSSTLRGSSSKVKMIG